MADTDKYYEILGLQPGASQEEIKQAYRDLAKVWHPDRFAHDPRLQQKAQEKLKEINEAKKYLLDSEYRTRARQSQARAQSGQSPPRSQARSQTRQPPPRSQTRQQQTDSQSRESQTHTESTGAGTEEARNPPRSAYTTYPLHSKSKAIYFWIIVFVAFVFYALYESSNSSNSSTIEQSTKKVTSFPTGAQSQINYIKKGIFQNDVLRIQGKPDRIDGRVWYYGESSITIQSGIVQSYIDRGNLRVRDKTKKAVKPVLLSKSDSDKKNEQPKAKQSTKEVNLRPLEIASEPQKRYFDVGSTKDEVLAVQGEPDKKTKYKWYYGSSYVDFSEVDERVMIYVNNDFNLKIERPFRIKNASIKTPSYLTIGSTKDEVLKIQGKPDRVLGLAWFYGESAVTIYNGKVDSYDNKGNLKVKDAAMVTASVSEISMSTKGYFDVGSTKDEVLAIQGKPDKIFGLAWYYGDSTVTIYKGKVEKYNNKGNLKVKGETEPDRVVTSTNQSTPIRVGGAIKSPRIKKKVPPVYPEIARRNGIYGIVIVEATVDVFGRIQHAKILRSIPPLDQAALDAVHQWEYEPLIVDGKPRSFTLSITLRFSNK